MQAYCPFCDEPIQATAKKCRHCGETIDPTLRSAEEARDAARRERSVSMDDDGGGAAASRSAAAAGGSVSRWYYATDNRQRLGPVTSEELRRLARSGEIGPACMVAREGSNKWAPAAKVKGLFASPPSALPVLPWRRSWTNNPRLVVLAVAVGLGLLTVLAAGVATLVRSGSQTDVNSLTAWCEKTGAEIRGANAANPIRGRELEARYLEQLNGRLLGKKVAWPFRILDIYPLFSEKRNGGVRVSSQFGQDRSSGCAAFIVWTTEVKQPEQAVYGMGKEQLRRLSVGDWITLTGRVTRVSCLATEQPEPVYFQGSIQDYIAGAQRGMGSLGTVPAPHCFWVVEVDNLKLK
jgi:hypothetical protein